MRPASSLIFILVLSLAACGDNNLRDLADPSAGPEEFEILPNKPLVVPENYKTLPTPTPGSANLVDATPKKDAIAALGGNPSLLDANTVPSSDTALVVNATRYGVPAGIRAQTTTEDEAFRKRRGRFSNIRLFKTDRYGSVYKRQTLDARKTLDASRRAGVKTPTAPPAN